MARTPNSTVASARPSRTPLSQRNRLAVKNQEAGYSYRIVNDIDDRVSRFQEAGWEIAPKENVGAVGDKRVDSASSLGSASHFSVGKGTSAVVMRIREEYAREDQANKLNEIAELENTMARKSGDYGDFKIQS